MTDGWRCPGCGRCYSPFTPSCSACDPGSYKTTTGYTAGGNLTCSRCLCNCAVTCDGLCPACYGSPAQEVRRG